MACRLPQELVCHIIAHCRWNIRSLTVLSLVSRAWLYHSRHHLFRVLETGISTLKANGEPLQDDAYTKEMGTLSRLLDSPHCTIAAHVRGLRVFLGRTENFVVLKSVLEMLPLDVVRTARLRGPPSLLHDEQLDIFTRLQSVTKLGLTRLSFRNSLDLIQSVASLSRLEVLSIEDVRIQDVDLENEQVPSHVHPSLYLQAIDLKSGTRLTIFLRWLYRSPNLILRTLSLCLRNTNMEEELAFLTTYGGKFETLDLQWLGGMFRLSELLNVDFSSLTKLTSITLIDCPTDQFMQLLASIPSFQLSRLELNLSSRFMSTGMTCLSNLQDHLDEELTGWSKLKQLVVNCSFSLVGYSQQALAMHQGMDKIRRLLDCPQLDGTDRLICVYEHELSWVERSGCMGEQSIWDHKRRPAQPIRVAHIPSIFA